MYLRRIFFLFCIIVTSLSIAANNRAKQKGFIIVTDYIDNEGKRDVSDDIQKIIDNNPNRTIYFPDGVYLIGKPIVTPANPNRSVALELSNFAIIKASDNWNSHEAMIRLGGKDPYNTIEINGSNYYMKGGIVDGNDKAKGISIDGGRETAVRETNIKNTTIGLHIKHGANGGSSDCDIHSVNIVGNHKKDCIGVLVEGWDNTFTNMRIGGVHIGVVIKSAGNYLRNIHPLYLTRNAEDIDGSCGFVEKVSGNWYDFCYSDQFATAFSIKGGGSFYHNCFAYWYSNKGAKHVVFKCEGKFEASIMNMRVGFTKANAAKENKILECTENGGNGIFSNLKIDGPECVTDISHEKFMTR